MKTPRKILEEIAQEIDTEHLVSVISIDFSGDYLEYILASEKIDIRQKIWFNFDEKKGRGARKKLIHNQDILYSAPDAYQKFEKRYKIKYPAFENPEFRIASILTPANPERIVCIERGSFKTKGGGINCSARQISLIDSKPVKKFFDIADKEYKKGVKSYELVYGAWELKIGSGSLLLTHKDFGDFQGEDRYTLRDDSLSTPSENLFAYFDGITEDIEKQAKLFRAVLNRKKDLSNLYK